MEEGNDSVIKVIQDEEADLVEKQVKVVIEGVLWRDERADTVKQLGVEEGQNKLIKDVRHGSLILLLLCRKIGEPVVGSRGPHDPRALLLSLLREA